MASNLQNSTLLISVKPKYGKLIFSGEKRAELRRVRPRLQQGDNVYVYYSSPEMKLAGLFRVKSVLAEEPATLWKFVKGQAGVTRAEYNAYFMGCKVGYAILVDTVAQFDNTVHLAELRRLINQFHPPQSYRYLSTREAASINTLGFNRGTHHLSSTRKFMSTGCDCQCESSMSIAKV